MKTEDHALGMSRKQGLNIKFPTYLCYLFTVALLFFIMNHINSNEKIVNGHLEGWEKDATYSDGWLHYICPADFDFDGSHRT